MWEALQEEHSTEGGRNAAPELRNTAAAWEQHVGSPAWPAAAG
jgi:hypothetical protein